MSYIEVSTFKVTQQPLRPLIFAELMIMSFPFILLAFTLKHLPLLLQFYL